MKSMSTHILANMLLVNIAIDRCKVAFVDTDRVPGREIKLGDLVQNPTEAKLILQVSCAAPMLKTLSRELT